MINDNKSMINNNAPMAEQNIWILTIETFECKINQIILPSIYDAKFVGGYSGGNYDEINIYS